MKKKSILILGGFSFLGIALVCTFLKKPEWDIFIIDKVNEGENLPFFIGNKRITYFESAIMDIESIPNILDRAFDVVANCIDIFKESDIKKIEGYPFFIKDINEEDKVIEKEIEILNKVLWINKKINLNNNIFFIPYSGRVRDVIINKINNTFKLSKTTIIMLPILFGVYDNILNLLPYLMINFIMKSNVMINLCIDKKYEWIYIEDAILQIREIISKSYLGVYSIKGDLYSIKEINELIIGLLDINLKIELEGKIDIQENKSNFYPNKYDVKVFQYQRFESIRERLVQTYEFLEDNRMFYNHILNQIEEGNNVNRGAVKKIN